MIQRLVVVVEQVVSVLAGPLLQRVCVCVVDLTLGLVETWGDEHYIGLTGVELLGQRGELIAVDVSMLDAQPRDLHHLAGNENDARTLDKSDSCVLLLLFVCFFTKNM